eukprot:1008896-Pleurochrysis_carterae.AAC.2
MRLNTSRCRCGGTNSLVKLGRVSSLMECRGTLPGKREGCRRSCWSCLQNGHSAAFSANWAQQRLLCKKGKTAAPSVQNGHTSAFCAVGASCAQRMERLRWERRLLRADAVVRHSVREACFGAKLNSRAKGTLWISVHASAEQKSVSPRLGLRC